MQRRDSFFGRRKGKRLRPGQAELLERRLPRLLVDIGEPPPARLEALFPVPVERVCLEIGFGGGEHLIHHALSEPGTSFIGIEPFVNGLAKALRAIDSHGLRNVRLYDQVAGPLLDWMPAGSLARIDLLYPDPWPKRRHWKRRFVNRQNLDRILDEWALLNYEAQRYEKADDLFRRLIEQVPDSDLVDNARLSLAESDLLADRLARTLWS